MNNISNKALSVITKPTVESIIKSTVLEKKLESLRKCHAAKKGKPDIVNELVFEYIVKYYSKTDFFNQTLMPLFEHFLNESERKLKDKRVATGTTKISLRRMPDILRIVLDEFGKGRFTTKKEGAETEVTIIYDGFKTQVKIDSLLRESISYLQSKKIIKSEDYINSNNKQCTKLVWIGKSQIKGL